MEHISTDRATQKRLLTQAGPVLVSVLSTQQAAVVEALRQKV